MVLNNVFYSLLETLRTVVDKDKVFGTLLIDLLIDLSHHYQKNKQTT